MLKNRYGNEREIKEFNVAMSYRGMGKVLYRNNLRYTTVTYVMEKYNKKQTRKIQRRF